MTPHELSAHTLPALDDATRALVRLSAVVTAGSEGEVRDALAQLAPRIPPAWIDELLLQSYLFAGFPRALNATREWRRIGPSAPAQADDGRGVDAWRRDGERTCAAVYGAMYDRLRTNIRGLHPLLDEWMITEGYGKVLSRAGLDLARRELCIVAACAAAGQERQLHSHLHGALNVGAAPAAVDETLAAIADLIGEAAAHSARLLWARVRGK
ncbi:MAG TPA: carboxymuconolactone decarboxylase family protein [Gemmatimonadaceae bacterium]|nr:carboxymuconolactone decarboxylase family protein [Gemmatimonadaceae bacterium]